MVDLRALAPWRSNKAQSPAVREDFLDPFVALRREMDRMFDHFFDGFPGRASTGSGAIAPHFTPRSLPRVADLKRTASRRVRQCRTLAELACTKRLKVKDACRDPPYIVDRNRVTHIWIHLRQLRVCPGCAREPLGRFLGEPIAPSTATGTRQESCIAFSSRVIQQFLR